MKALESAVLSMSKTRSKKKLDVDFRQYRIPDACNLEQAHKGLQEEVQSGAPYPIMSLSTRQMMKQWA